MTMAYWIVSGMAGVIVRDLWSLFSKTVGLDKFYIWNVDADLFTTRAGAMTAWGTVLGFLTDLVVGSIFGVVLGLLLEWRGVKHYALKGMGVGLTAWFFFYGILFHNLPHTSAIAPSDPLSNISAFIGHAIFGLAMSGIYVKVFYKREGNRTARN